MLVSARMSKTGDGSNIPYHGRFNKLNKTWSRIGTNGCNGPMSSFFATNQSLLACGYSSTTCGTAGAGISRANFNTNQWTALNGGSLTGSCSAIVSNSNESIIVVVGNIQRGAGDTTTIGVQLYDSITWSEIGYFESDSSSSAYPRAVLISPVSGRIYIGGDFNNVSGSLCQTFASYYAGAWRCDGAGQAVSTVNAFAFNTSSSDENLWIGATNGLFFYDNSSIYLTASLDVYDLVYDRTHDLLYGISNLPGSVFSLNAAGTIGRLNGGLLGGYNPSGAQHVISLALDSTGIVYFGGSFLRTATGLCVNGLVAWNPTTTVVVPSIPNTPTNWTSAQTNLDGDVKAIEFSGDYVYSGYDGKNKNGK